MPVVSPSTAENRPSLGQPTRLRLTGRTKLSGRLSPQSDLAAASSQLPASAFEGDTPALAATLQQKRTRTIWLTPQAC